MKKQIILGYCPTMEPLAKEIASKKENISLQPFSFTAQALPALKAGVVDLVLVGRVAKKFELSDVYEKRLKSGLTLVGDEKRAIYVTDLKNSVIHTAIDREVVKNYFSDLSNFKFYKSTEEAIAKGIHDIVLIDWKDYTDDLELVIPVDDYGNKVEKYRIPIIYTFDKDIISNINL